MPDREDSVDSGHGERTADHSYTERMTGLDSSWWRRLLPVQAPYRWNARRLRLGRVLDIGCGLGRTLGHLDGNGVGVDHNPEFVAHCRALGYTAYSTEEWPSSPDAVPESFDGMVLSHVIEHLDPSVSDEILDSYLPYIRHGGRILFITPQERGYRSDATHVAFSDFAVLEDLAGRHGLVNERSFSFPFPRSFGKAFIYNEFNVVSRKP